MRDGAFTVRFRRSTAAGGEPFPEEEVGGDVHVVAEPNADYRVEVEVDPLHAQLAGCEGLLLKFTVDGMDVGYGKRVDLRGNRRAARCTFDGFRKAGDTQYAFRFAATRADIVGPADTDGNTDLGTVRLEVFRAHPSRAYFVGASRRGGVADMPGTQHLSDGKKFFKQASVSTAAGGCLGGMSISQYAWPFDLYAMATIVVPYHTHMILKYKRKHLEQQHQQREAPAARAPPATSGAAGAAAAAAAASVATGTEADEQKPHCAQQPRKKMRVLIDLTAEDDGDEEKEEEVKVTEIA